MIRWAVGRPVAVLMLFAALVLTGALALKRLPVDLLPAINYPNLTVITGYADTPADDLTRLVTEPLEEVIAGLAGVRRVVSRTREGFSTITVQYEWGTDMDFANLHLREAIDRVAYREDFPAAADRPLIFEPFYRPDSSRTRATGGTGLGLYLARQVARAHGGELVLVDPPGGGAEFIARLPLRAA